MHHISPRSLYKTGCFEICNELYDLGGFSY